MRKASSLDIPVGSPGIEFEVVVVLQPKVYGQPGEASEKPSWDEFIAKTAGCWEGEFIRDQGRFDQGIEP